MAIISATVVAFTGFRFVREHRKVVLIWAVVHFVMAMVFGALTVKVMGPAMTNLQGMGLWTRHDPKTTAAMLAAMRPMYAVMLPGLLIFYPVLFAAINRAVLRPADSAFAYLRLGQDELKQGLLMFLTVAVGFGFEIVCGLVLVVVIVIAVFLTKALSGHNDWWIALAPLLFLVVVGFFAVRLSLASALTFDRRRVNLFGSWKLTRGHFWKIFGAYALTFALVVLLSVLVLVIIAGAAAAMGGLAGVKALFKPDMTSFAAYYSPSRIVISAINAVLAAVIWPVMLMVQPAIYQRLIAEPGIVAP